MKRLAVWIGIVLLAVWLTACSAIVPTRKTIRAQQIPLRYWSAGQNVSGEKNISAKLEQETGVQVEWIHPPEGQEQEAFSLMVVSNQLPDLIEYDWYHFSGGPDKAIDSKIILSLNHFLETDLPNLKKLYAERQEYAAEMQTANGHYYMYPWILPEQKGEAVGACIRGEFLQCLPQTPEEWEIALETLKQSGTEIPLCLRIGESNRDLDYFAAMFDLAPSFYLEEETVKFGPYQARWKEFIQCLQRWQQRGLLYLADTKQAADWIAEGNVGAAVGTGEEIETWKRGVQETRHETEFVPVPLQEGRIKELLKSKTGVQPYGTAVSVQCRQPQLACRLLEEEYGAAEKTLQEATQTFARFQKAVPVGAKTLQENGMLPLTYLTEKEKRDYDKIMQEVIPWCRQETVDFIMGNKMTEAWEQYHMALQKMGIEKALQIRQAAYERYRNRRNDW